MNEKNEPLRLENISNLTHEFLHDNFKKKINIFLLKLSYKNSFVKFNAFSRQNGSFIFPQKGGAEKQECLYISSCMHDMS